jgi:hypothetical protein
VFQLPSGFPVDITVRSASGSMVFSATNPTGRYLLVYDPDRATVDPGGAITFAVVDARGEVVAEMLTWAH